MWRWIIRVHHRRFEGDVAGKTLFELSLENINCWNYAEFDCDLSFCTNSDVGFLVLFLIFIQQTLVFFHARFWCFLWPFFVLCSLLALYSFLPTRPLSPLPFPLVALSSITSRLRNKFRAKMKSAPDTHDLCECFSRGDQNQHHSEIRIPLSPSPASLPPPLERSLHNLAHKVKVKVKVAITALFPPYLSPTWCTRAPDSGPNDDDPHSYRTQTHTHINTVSIIDLKVSRRVCGLISSHSPLLSSC